MKFYKVKCPICDTYDNYTILYAKNFSDKDLNTKVFSARRLPDRIHYQLVRCKKCGLVRSDPVADTKTLNQLYARSIFTYDSEVDNLKKTYVESLLPYLNRLSKKASILEIGCGNGFVLEEIYRLGYKNIYGIEPSIDAKEKAKPKIFKSITSGIFDESVYKNKKFDLIFMFQTLDHIPNPNLFMKNIYAKLKNDGYFLAFNHNVSSVSAKILGEKSPIIDIEHTFLYDKKTARRLFELEKLRVEKIYSPTNYVSIGHLLYLLPLPKRTKLKILKSRSKWLNFSIKIGLGNLCIIGQKCEID